MNEQLDLFKQPKKTRNLLAETLHERYDFYGDANVWFTAKELGFVTNKERRELRQFAEDSTGDDRIISGNRGYCLASLATPDELKHFGNRLISQAKKMEKRGIAALHLLHQIQEGKERKHAESKEPTLYL